MATHSLRPPSVAGSWYPGDPDSLTREVDRYLDRVESVPPAEPRAVIAPHAGLMYSGPVAAHAYKAVAGRAFEAAVLVGPSHFEAFDGVALYGRGAFETPLGVVPIAEALAADIAEGCPRIVHAPAVHGREHSLEMQLPFLQRVLPRIPIVPLLMGDQTRETIVDLAAALSRGLAGRPTLIVASTDLSHYFDAPTAGRLDGRVAALVGQLDPEGLLAEMESYPEHERGRFVACGAGPTVSVMMAARALGARHARVLHYADSGDVSGDKRAVVGYLAAVLGTDPWPN